MDKPFAVVIMAAGKGTRMKSELPKVLAPVLGKPMLGYTLDTARKLEPAKIVVVVGYKKELVMEMYEDAGLTWAVQEAQLGTGHAVAQAEEALAGFHGDIVTLSGDAPLVKPETILNMIRLHRASGAAITALTCELDDPKSYGRIIRDGDRIIANVEAKDATPEQLAIKEINSGIYVFDSRFLFDALQKVDNNNAQKEYYLTDLLKIATDAGLVVIGLKAEDPKEILGANSAEELKKLEEAMRG